jgi:hypothetical protein
MLVFRRMAVVLGSDDVGDVGGVMRFRFEGVDVEFDC